MTGQLPLFGRQYVHLGRYSRTAGFVVCVMCKVSLAIAELYDDCSSCRGFVEPAPPWSVLGAVQEPLGPLPLAASLEAA